MKNKKQYHPTFGAKLRQTIRKYVEEQKTRG